MADFERPLPPDVLGREVELFLPAPDVKQWLTECYLEDGPLFNADHSHLLLADIGVLWTSAQHEKNMRRASGTAEIPNVSGKSWVKARERFQLERWFGKIPDFLLTFDAVDAAEAEDWDWCALVDHELYHCAQQLDRYGSPRWMGPVPVWGIRGHDVEQHLGVTERWGLVTESERKMVDLASRRPLIAQAQLSLACGLCLRS